MCFFEKCIDIIFSKTEIFIQAGMTDGVGYKIISACKNAFLCNFEATGNHRKAEIGVIFECGAQKRFNQAEHFGIIPMAAGFCKWNIVFVQ